MRYFLPFSAEESIALLIKGKPKTVFCSCFCILRQSVGGGLGVKKGELLHFSPLSYQKSSVSEDFMSACNHLRWTAEELLIWSVFYSVVVIKFESSMWFFQCIATTRPPDELEITILWRYFQLDSLDLISSRTSAKISDKKSDKMKVSWHFLRNQCQHKLQCNMW